MLQAVLDPNSSSFDESFEKSRTQIQFMFPPKNTQLMKWKSKQELQTYLHRKAYELGFFQGRMFRVLKQRDRFHGQLKCKLCQAKMNLIMSEDGVRISQLQNYHVHELKQHQPQFMKMFTFFQENSLDKNIDIIADLFNFDDKERVWQIQNIYYQHFITFDEIIQKIRLQNQIQIRVWKDGNNMPYMLLLISEKMKQSYATFGDSLCYDALPRVSQVLRSQTHGQFWVLNSFVGLDSNNRLSIFGMNLVIFNSTAYYKKPEVIYTVFENFFEIMGGKMPITFITNESPAILQAIDRLRLKYNSDWIHLIGWSYKLKNIKIQMKNKQYTAQQIKPLIALYSELLKQPDLQVFAETVIKIINKSWQRDILYDFLINMNKYCFIAFPDKYCGYGLTLHKTQMFQTMAHNFLKRHNIHRHLTYFLHYQILMLRKSKKLQLVAKAHHMNVEHQIKRMIASIERTLAVFRNKQILKPYALERKLFIKMTEVFNAQRYIIAQKIRPNLYNIMRSSNRNDICKVVYLQDDKKWHCSCMYFIKLGIPCPHLFQVMLCEKCEIPLYFNPRWLKKVEDEPRLGIPTISRKKRRHQ